MSMKYVCPNCGAEFSDNGTETPKIACPYCGTRIKNKAYANDRERVEKPKYIVKEHFSDEDIKEVQSEIVSMLLEKDNTPLDVFNHLKFGDIKLIYLPMYQYKGTFEAPWSCTVVREQYVRIGDKKEKIENCYPANGVAMGSFKFLCLANKNDKLPEGLREFAQIHERDFSGDADPYTDSDIDDIEDAIIILADKKESEMWNDRSIEEYVEKKAGDAAYKQTPYDNRDFSYSFKYKASKGVLYLVPFYVAKYFYNKKEYYYIGRFDRIDYKATFPTDKNISNKTSNMDKKSTHSFYWALGTYLCAVLVGILYDYMTGFRFTLFLSLMATSIFFICKSTFLDKKKETYTTSLLGQKKTLAREFCKKNGVAYPLDVEDDDEDVSDVVSTKKADNDINDTLFKWFGNAVVVCVYLVPILFAFVLFGRRPQEKTVVPPQQTYVQKTPTRKVVVQEKPLSDILNLGFPSGVRYIYVSGNMDYKSDTLVYEFNKQGYLCGLTKIEADRKRTEYVVSDGKLISMTEIKKDCGFDEDYRLCEKCEENHYKIKYKDIEETYVANGESKLLKSAEIYKVKDGEETFLTYIRYDEEGRPTSSFIKYDAKGNAKYSNHGQIVIVDALFKTCIYLPETYRILDGTKEQPRAIEIDNRTMISIVYWPDKPKEDVSDNNTIGNNTLDVTKEEMPMDEIED